MPRVMICGMGAITRLGLRECFDDEGVDVVAEEIDTTRLVDRMVDALPDVVVLDLDGAETEELAQDLAGRFPSVTVVACSTVTPQMRVFPPFHHGESYVSTLEPGSLMRALNATG